jgi:hypothetical protein
LSRTVRSAACQGGSEGPGGAVEGGREASKEASGSGAEALSRAIDPSSGYGRPGG